MNAVTLSLPDEVLERLTQFAATQGVTLNHLMQELAQAAIVAQDAEARFAALAATSDRTLALAVLDRLDRHDHRCGRSIRAWAEPRWRVLVSRSQRSIARP